MLESYREDAGHRNARGEAYRQVVAWIDEVVVFKFESRKEKFPLHIAEMIGIALVKKSGGLVTFPEPSPGITVDQCRAHAEGEAVLPSVEQHSSQPDVRSAG